MNDQQKAIARLEHHILMLQKSDKNGGCAPLQRKIAQLRYTLEQARRGIY